MHHIALKFCGINDVTFTSPDSLELKMIQNRQLIKSKSDPSLSSNSDEDMSPDQQQALENFLADKTISDVFYKMIDVIKNSDIALEDKTDLVGQFNATYKDRYKLDVSILTEGSKHKSFTAKLICPNTNLEFESFSSSFVSFTKAKRLKEQFFPPPPQDKTSFFSNTNKCKSALLCASVTVGVAALTYLRFGR